LGFFEEALGAEADVVLCTVCISSLCALDQLWSSLAAPGPGFAVNGQLHPDQPAANISADARYSFFCQLHKELLGCIVLLMVRLLRGFC
jgi:hypothetical protein